MRLIQKSKWSNGPSHRLPPVVSSLPGFIGWAGADMVCSFVSQNDHYQRDTCDSSSSELEHFVLRFRARAAVNCFSGSGKVISASLSQCSPPRRLCELPCPRPRDTLDSFSFLTGFLFPEGWHSLQGTGAQARLAALAFSFLLGM